MQIPKEKRLRLSVNAPSTPGKPLCIQPGSEQNVCGIIASLSDNAHKDSKTCVHRERLAADMDLAPLWKGIVLGLGAAAPIGPVNVEIARRSLRGGFIAGLLLGCGAVTIDVLYLALASLGVASMIGRPGMMLVVGIIGAGVLAYLGIGALRSAWKHSALASATNDSAMPPPRRNYVTGLVMTALNPLTLAFWFAATPSLAADASRRQIPLACAGVAIGALSWVCFFATLMSLARRLNRRRVEAIADAVGGVTLIGFALYTIWRVITPFL